MKILFSLSLTTKKQYFATDPQLSVWAIFVKLHRFVLLPTYFYMKEFLLSVFFILYIKEHFLQAFLPHKILIEIRNV